MKIDQIALQGVGKPLGSVHGSFPGFTAGGDESSGAAGTDNSPVTLGFDTDVSKPISFSFLPQSGTPGGGDAFNAFATPAPVTLIEDYESGFPKSGPTSVEFFAKPGGGGGGGGGPGGGGGGAGTSRDYLSAPLGFHINYDSSVNNAPGGFATFEAAFAQAIGYFQSNFTTPRAGHAITVTLDVGWGEAGGTKLSTFALGQSLTYIEQRSYSEFQPLVAPMASMPSTDPIASQHQYWVPTAEERALGLTPPASALATDGADGAVGFGTRFSWDFSGNVPAGSGNYDFVAVAKHEISEAMGRIAVLGGTVGGIPNSYTPFDLFRFTDVNTRSLTGGANAYFSYDGGTSSGAADLAGNSKTYFNTTAGGDWGDWQSSGAHTAGKDAYDAFANPGSYSSSPVDLAVMRALGYGTV